MICSKARCRVQCARDMALRMNRIRLKRLHWENSGLVAAATMILLLLLISAVAAEDSICEIATKPTTFDHRNVVLQGAAINLKETTSHRGNDYTTFALQDPSGCGVVKIFTWGHPRLNEGDRVRVEGVFETEHHQGRYTFYNEVEATKVVAEPR